MEDKIKSFKNEVKSELWKASNNVYYDYSQCGRNEKQYLEQLEKLFILLLGIENTFEHFRVNERLDLLRKENLANRCEK